MTDKAKRTFRGAKVHESRKKTPLTCRNCDSYILIPTRPVVDVTDVLRCPDCDSIVKDERPHVEQYRQPNCSQHETWLQVAHKIEEKKLTGIGMNVYLNAREQFLIRDLLRAELYDAPSILVDKSLICSKCGKDTDV